MDTTDFNHENSNEIPNAWLHQCTALHVGLKLVHGTAKSKPCGLDLVFRL